MELLTHRYRNLGTLALVILMQVVLLGYQVKTQGEIRLVRVWAVTAITPVARVVEAVRRGASSLVDKYVLLMDAQEENARLRRERDGLKIEVRHLQAELGTAERGRALQQFRERIPSRTLAGRVIGAGTGSGSYVVFIDRGSGSGVAKGMAVITAEGVVGRVSAAYPTASQVVLITDPSFAAGVISHRNHVRGTLKGDGEGLCFVDYVDNDQVVEPGEWFYTSGDERVFPRGLPAGIVRSVEEGSTLKKIVVEPVGLKYGIEEVLVVIEGVHMPIPSGESSPGELLPPPSSGIAGEEISAAPPSEQEPSPAPSNARGTDADRLLKHYRRLGEAQDHVYGESLPGEPPPDFNDGSPPFPGARSESRFSSPNLRESP